MSTPAQITICGALGKEAIAALVEVAMAAGAALMVQPRASAAAVPVVEASPPSKALPPARYGTRKRVAQAVTGTVDDRIRRVLRDGPVSLKDLRRVAPLRQIRQLVDAGVIVATGATSSRRYALPGHSAKEAP